MFDFLDEAANVPREPPVPVGKIERQLPIIRKPVPVSESGPLRAPSMSDAPEDDDFDFLSGHDGPLSGTAGADTVELPPHELDGEPADRSGRLRPALYLLAFVLLGAGGVVTIWPYLPFGPGIPGERSSEPFASTNVPAGDEPGDEPAVDASGASAAPEAGTAATAGAPRSLGARFRDEIARIEGLVGEGRLDDASRALASLDRAVYGYGIAEFSELETRIAQLSAGGATPVDVADRAAERQEAARREAERVAEAERQEAARAAEAERLAEAERQEAARAAEAERLAEAERQEAARAAEAERLAEAERQEAARAAEAERLAEAERQEAARAAEAERLAEAERQEAARAAEAERLAEAERQEAARAAEAERLAEAERQEAARQAAEQAAEAERLETERVAETERIASRAAAAERDRVRRAQLAAERAAREAEASRARAEARDAARLRAEALVSGRGPLGGADSDSTAAAVSRVPDVSTRPGEAVTKPTIADAASGAAEARQRAADARATTIAADRLATDRRIAEQRAAAAEEARRLAALETSVPVRSQTRSQTPTVVVPLPASPPTIEDGDLEIVYTSLLELKNAFEDRDIATVIRLSDPPGGRVQQLLQIFANSEAVNARITNVSARPADEAITGTLRIENIVRADGRRVSPPPEFAEVALTSTRRGDGWSSLSW